MKKQLFFALLLLACAFVAPAQPVFLYPGDTNNDGRADYLDLLPIGLAYNVTFLAEPRIDTATAWKAVFSEPWPQFLPRSGVNFAFIDTNGDRRIDTFDLNPIKRNYDSLQLKSQPPPQPWRLPDTVVSAGDPRIEVVFQQGTQPDVLFARILYKTNIINNLVAMGAAIHLQYDPTYVRDSFTQVTFNPANTDLMGVAATFRSVTLERQLPPGNIQMSVSGRGAEALSISRELATVKFIIVEDVIIRKGTDTIVPFTLKFKNTLLLNGQEQVVRVKTAAQTIKFKVVTAPEPAQPDALLFPNPASGLVRIEAGAVVHRAVLWSLQGNQWLDLEPDTATFDMPLQTCPPGIYWLEIQTGKGKIRKKLVVQP